MSKIVREVELRLSLSGFISVLVMTVPGEGSASRIATVSETVWPGARVAIGPIDQPALTLLGVSGAQMSAKVEVLQVEGTSCAPARPAE
jgi:hypothetical protein